MPCNHEFRTVELFTSTIEECRHCEKSKAQIDAASKQMTVSEAIISDIGSIQPRSGYAPLADNQLFGINPSTYKLWSGYAQSIDLDPGIYSYQFFGGEIVVTSLTQIPRDGVFNWVTLQPGYRWHLSGTCPEDLKIEAISVYPPLRGSSENFVEQAYDKASGLNSSMALKVIPASEQDKKAAAMVQGVLDSYQEHINAHVIALWSNSVIYGNNYLYYSKPFSAESFPDVSPNPEDQRKRTWTNMRERIQAEGYRRVIDFDEDFDTLFISCENFEKLNGEVSQGLPNAGVQFITMWIEGFKASVYPSTFLTNDQFAFSQIDKEYS